MHGPRPAAARNRVGESHVSAVQLGEAKRMVNTLCVDAGREPIYVVVHEDAMPAGVDTVGLISRRD